MKEIVTNVAGIVLAYVFNRALVYGGLILSFCLMPLVPIVVLTLIFLAPVIAPVLAVVGLAVVGG